MLYQQGTQRIEVIVRKQSGGGISGGAGTKAARKARAWERARA